MSSISSALEFATRRSISAMALRVSAALTARDSRDPDVDSNTDPPSPFEREAPIALLMWDFPVPGTPYKNSGLYIVPGEDTTDIAAACAKRLYAPTSKVSSVQSDRRSAVSGNSASAPARGGTEAGAAAGTAMT